MAVMHTSNAAAEARSQRCRITLLDSTTIAIAHSLHATHSGRHLTDPCKASLSPECAMTVAEFGLSFGNQRHDGDQQQCR